MRGQRESLDCFEESFFDGDLLYHLNAHTKSALLKQLTKRLAID